jgi:hypothetical protein
MLEIRPWEEAHPMTEAVGANMPVGNMEWALMDFPGTHDIVEYESRTDYPLPKYDMATLGTYDLAKLSASLLMDILRTTRM